MQPKLPKHLCIQKSQPLTSYNVNFNPKQADLKSHVEEETSFLSKWHRGGADTVCGMIISRSVQSGELVTVLKTYCIR